MTGFLIVFAAVAGIALGGWLGWEVRGAVEARERQLEAARRRAADGRASSACTCISCRPSAQRGAEGAPITEGQARRSPSVPDTEEGT